MEIKSTGPAKIAVSIYNRANILTSQILPASVADFWPKVNIGSFDAKCPNPELGFLHLYNEKPTSQDITEFIDSLRIDTKQRVFMSAVYLHNPKGSKTKAEYFSEIKFKFESLLGAGFINVTPLLSEKQGTPYIPFICADDMSNLILKMDRLKIVVDDEAKKLNWDIYDPSTYLLMSDFTFKE